MTSREYKFIRVSPKVHEKLKAYADLLSAQEDRNVSLSNAINILLSKDEAGK